MTSARGLQVVPAVDVLDGAVVRLLRGDFGRVTRYGDDPAAVARHWVAEGAGLVHVVDLGAARGADADRDLWRRLGAAGIPFQIGGGIGDAATAAAVVAAGARRVVVGSAALRRDGTLGAIVGEVGADRVVVALDVRAGRARGAGWTDDGVPVAAALEWIGEAGVVRLLVTGIERDGALGGPDLRLLDEVAEAAPAFRLIASGGVASLEDLRVLAATGCEAAVVGRALYEGRFSLREALRAVAPG